MGTSSLQNTLDSHIVYERLVNAGCPSAQANAHCEIQRMNDVAQKNFIMDAIRDLPTRDEMKKEMSDLSNRMSSEISDVKHSLLRWQIGIAIAVIGIIKVLK